MEKKYWIIIGLAFGLVFLIALAYFLIQVLGGEGLITDIVNGWFGTPGTTA